MGSNHCTRHPLRCVLPHVRYSATPNARWWASLAELCVACLRRALAQARRNAPFESHAQDLMSGRICTCCTTT